jgi:Beta-lactamase
VTAVDVFEAVQAAREEHGVPGVVVGVLDDGVERHQGFGVTSVENPLEVTPDTRFRIGLITNQDVHGHGGLRARGPRCARSRPAGA